MALVTGAGSGIGRAIALAIAAEGANLWLVGRTLSKLQQVAESTKRSAEGVRCFQADLTRDTEVAELAAGIRRDTGGIDLLVHCAGCFSRGRLDSVAIADLDLLYRTNVRAPYLLTQALLPMIRSRQGQIVFMNSSAGVVASPNVGQYAATKFALRAIADSLRQEIDPEGVRILSVYPGRTATPMQEAVRAAEDKPYDPLRLMRPEDVASAVLNALELPRTAQVTDIHLRPLIKT